MNWGWGHCMFYGLFRAGITGRNLCSAARIQCLCILKPWMVSCHELTQFLTGEPMSDFSDQAIQGGIGNLTQVTTLASKHT